MIAKRHRFHGHNSVRNVRGRPLVFSSFRVFSSKRPNNKPYRMAVVVSKKVHKSAVVRNRIRRRLYEAVRVGGLVDAAPVDMVFVVQSTDVATVPAEELQKMVWSACEKVRKLHSS